MAGFLFASLSPGEIPGLEPPGRRCGSGCNRARHLDENRRTRPALPRSPNSAPGVDRSRGRHRVIKAVLDSVLWAARSAVGEGGDSLSPSLGPPVSSPWTRRMSLLLGSKNLRAGVVPSELLPPCQPLAPTSVVACPGDASKWVNTFRCLMPCLETVKCPPGILGSLQTVWFLSGGTHSPKIPWECLEGSESEKHLSA